MKSEKIGNSTTPNLKQSRIETQPVKVESVSNPKKESYFAKLTKASEGILFSPPVEVSGVRPELDKKEVSRQLKELEGRAFETKYEPSDVKNGREAIEKLVENGNVEILTNPFTLKLAYGEGITKLLNPKAELSDKEIAEVMPKINTDLFGDLLQGESLFHQSTEVVRAPRIDETRDTMDQIIHELRNEDLNLDEKIGNLQGRLHDIFITKEGNIDPKRAHTVVTTLNLLTSHPTELRKALKSENYTAGDVLNNIIRNEVGVSPKVMDRIGQEAQSSVLEQTKLLKSEKGLNPEVDLVYENLSKQLGVNSEDLRYFIQSSPDEVLAGTIRSTNVLDKLNALQKDRTGKLKWAIAVPGAFSSILTSAATVEAAGQISKETGLTTGNTLYNTLAVTTVLGIGWIAGRGFGGAGKDYGNLLSGERWKRIIGNPKNIKEFLDDRYSLAKNPDVTRAISDLTGTRNAIDNEISFYRKLSGNVKDVEKDELIGNNGVERKITELESLFRILNSRDITPQDIERYRRDNPNRPREIALLEHYRPNSGDYLLSRIQTLESQLNNLRVSGSSDLTEIANREDEIKNLKELQRVVVSFPMMRTDMDTYRRDHPNNNEADALLRKYGPIGSEDIRARLVLLEDLNEINKLPFGGSAQRKARYTELVGLENRYTNSENSWNRQLGEVEKTINVMNSLRSNYIPTDIAAVLAFGLPGLFYRYYLGGIVDTTYFKADPLTKRGVDKIPWLGKRIVQFGGNSLVWGGLGINIFNLISHNTYHLEINGWESVYNGTGKSGLESAIPALYDNYLNHIYGPSQLLANMIQFPMDRLSEAVNKDTKFIPPTKGTGGSDNQLQITTEDGTKLGPPPGSDEKAPKLTK